MKKTYKLLNIALLESFFKRATIINFENTKFKNNLNIETENSTENNHLFVTVTVDYLSMLEEKKVIEAKIIMSGIFEYDNEPILPIEKFARINAPAIIFPFIREHLASISLKAGIQSILLPPINFVKLNDKNNTE